jgi:hypothetical protein
MKVDTFSMTMDVDDIRLKFVPDGDNKGNVSNHKKLKK